MDDLRVGALLRVLRRRRGWRQIDLARAAGCDQKLISTVERGFLDRLSVHRLRLIGKVLEVELRFEPRWRRGDVDRLLDEAHANLVEHVVTVLRRLGWTVIVEYSFNF